MSVLATEIYVAVPIAVIISLAVAVASFIRSNGANQKLEELKGGQRDCKACLDILRDNSTKSITLLEAIRDNTAKHP